MGLSLAIRPTSLSSVFLKKGRFKDVLLMILRASKLPRQASVGLHRVLYHKIFRLSLVLNPCLLLQQGGCGPICFWSPGTETKSSFAPSMSLAKLGAELVPGPLPTCYLSLRSGNFQRTPGASPFWPNILVDLDQSFIGLEESDARLEESAREEGRTAKGW